MQGIASLDLGLFVPKSTDKEKISVSVLPSFIEKTGHLKSPNTKGHSR
jgi:hypothetical protein